MKKWIKILRWFLGIILIVLLIFNYRYSFFSPSSNGWSIGFKTADNPLEPIFPSVKNIISYDSLNNITGNQTKFLADPFLFYEKGIYYLFFEHQEKKGPAKIGLLQSSDGLNYIYKGNVIDESFHLSFPQIFKYRNDYYILPESASINQVVLYKAKNFPMNWEISDTLIKNTKLKDPAILLSDSLNLISGTDSNLKQYIYSAESLLDKWKLDPSFKTRKGDEIRAGGNFFSTDGEWYIPFQMNTEGYGTGVSLYRLKNKKFEKIISRHLYKSDSIKWFAKGMHHLNVNKINDDYYLVYDGDVKSPESLMTWKASIKYNLYDIYNLIF